MYHDSGVADVIEAYGKIDVSAPAIVGGQVIFTITMLKNCSHTDNWQYTINNKTSVYNVDEETMENKSFL